MTYAEAKWDALSDVQAFAAFPSITDSVFMRLISEAVHQIQIKSHAIKKVITFEMTSLDADGSIALDKSITLPFRPTFTPVNGQPFPMETKGPDEFAYIKMSWGAQLWPVLQFRHPRIFCTLEQSKLSIWPFAGLLGTVNIMSYAKMPVYQPSLTTDTTSYWYDWTTANLQIKMTTLTLPQEFDDCEEGIIAYVAARLLTFIPGWKKRFFEDYQERMLKFENCIQAAIDNAPTFPENYEPRVNYGF